MIYGYLFYPLYTLGMERIFQLTETAITTKCELIGISSKGTFENKINRLVQNGIMTSSDGESWHSTRDIRNHVSHPRQYEAKLPQKVLFIFRTLVTDINKLF